MNDLKEFLSEKRKKNFEKYKIGNTIIGRFDEIGTNRVIELIKNDSSEKVFVNLRTKK